MHWVLSVDESGNFEEPDDVAVAGVVLPRDLDVSPSLRELYPVMRLPHRTDLRFAASWPLAAWTWALDGHPRTPAEIFTKLAGGIERVSHAGAELPALKAAIDRGHLRFDRAAGRRRSLIAATEDWLRRQHFPEWSAAQEHRDITEQDFSRAVRKLEHESLSRCQVRPFVVGAAGRSDEPVSAYATKIGAVVDNYVDLLEATFERLGSLLSPADKVDLEILERHLDFGAERRPMRCEEAEQLARAHLGDRIGSIRILEFGPPQEWHRVVLADFAAWALRVAIRRSGRKFHRAERYFGELFGLGIRRRVWGGAKVSTIAAGGVVRDATLAGNPDELPFSDWRSEQAAEWLLARQGAH